MPGMNPAMHRDEIMKKRILIVDDDTSVRDALKKLLKKANYDASVAGDGLEAVEHFFSEHFDLLILDLDMPRKDGWAASENITRLNPYVPIVIMTGFFFFFYFFSAT